MSTKSTVSTKDIEHAIRTNAGDVQIASDVVATCIALVLRDIESTTRCAVADERTNGRLDADTFADWWRAP